MKKAYCLAIVIVLMVTQVCFAGSYFKSGMSLMQDVREWVKYYRGEKVFSLRRASYFQGYVAGVLDAYGETIKTPESFTLDQACAIVSKYFKENPERLNEPGSVLIRDSLKKAYGR